MSASTSGGGPLSPQASAALQEGIRLVFGRWTALQMAVENEWGGRDSRAKADQLAASIFSWFANSKGPYYYDDLEDMMFNSISESFNADFEDGSVGEVAEQLLIMHEECLQSNFSSVEKLRNTRPQGNAVSQSRKMVTDDDDDSSDDDDELSMGGDEEYMSDDMAVDEPKPSKPTPDAEPKSSKATPDAEPKPSKFTPDAKPKPSKPTPDADGWTVVPPRRGQGKN